jgi:hypothetical protein
MLLGTPLVFNEGNNHGATTGNECLMRVRNAWWRGPALWEVVASPQARLSQRAHLALRPPSTALSRCLRASRLLSSLLASSSV